MQPMPIVIVNKNKPLYVVLRGLPGTGKSTFRKCIEQEFIDNGIDYVVLSTDDYIDSVAASQNTTYNDVFKSAIKHASILLKADRVDAIRNLKHIIHDQTNLHFSKFPELENYNTVIINLSADENIHATALSGRVGKSIPYHVMEQMRQNSVLPVYGDYTYDIHNFRHVGKKFTILDFINIQ